MRLHLTQDPAADTGPIRPTRTTFDDRRFRDVLGHFPTGVTVITAIDAAGQPAGFAVGSFTSVSLDPPLVAFLPAGRRPPSRRSARRRPSVSTFSARTRRR